MKLSIRGKVSRIRWRMTSLVLLIVTALSLKFFSYQTVARYLPKRCNRICPAWRKRQVLADISWAARIVPGAKCLPQALAGYTVITWLGFEARVQIGVRMSDRNFGAHAVLLSGDDVVLGDGPDWKSFSVLTELRPGS